MRPTAAEIFRWGARNAICWVQVHGLKPVGCLWATLLLGVLAWLNRQDAGMTFCFRLSRRR
jgi:hypothetical protein